MGRLIDADVLREEVYSWNMNDYEPSDFTDAIDDALTVDAIPKADYENRLKADMVAMLEELQQEIKEKATQICDNGWWLSYNWLIQQKINELKADQEGERMTRECIEDFREIVLPFLNRTLLETNYENMGKSDAEEFKKDFNEILDLAIKAIEQEPRKGHWILDETGNRITCDKCGCLIWANDISNGEAYFCPNCGSKMESEDQDED